MGGSIYDIRQYGKSGVGLKPTITTTSPDVIDYSLHTRPAADGGIPDVDLSAGFGMNMGTAGMGLQGLATIGGIWNAYQSQKLAKEQFAFTKAMANTNLNNQIKSYNTALSDRSRTRGAMEGQSAAQVQSYIDTNQMTR